MPTIETLLQNIGLSAAPMVVLAVSVLVGLGALLYGYRLVRLFVFLAGLVVGTVVASIFWNDIVVLIVGLIVGGLCVALWDLGVFIIGCALGGLLAMAAGANGAVIVGIAAIIGGVLALAVRKLMLIVSTSWMGAYLLVGAVALLFKITNPGLLLGATFVVMIVGIVCQYTITSGDRKKDSGEKGDESKKDAEKK